MENLELKATVSENNFSLDKLNSQIEMTMERFTELEDKSIEVIQCERERIKNRKRK